MTKVTYLIGAGASANAIPVVNGLADGFNVFVQYLVGEFNAYLSIAQKKRLNDLVVNIYKHATIDTYAKKLFLQRETNDYKELKKILSAYLLFEQLKKNMLGVKGDKYKNALEIAKKVKQKLYIDCGISEQVSYEIKNDLDKRYDSFLASILNNSLKLPDNISIISWNYDLQFEKSYANFANCSIKDTFRHLNVQGNNTLGVVNDSMDGFSLIKLNGSGYFYNQENGEVLIDLSNDTLDNTLLDKFKEYLFINDSDIMIPILFAWEKHSWDVTKINCANKKLIESDVIVVIGYSFPYFNREIDRAIFKEVANQKIYIQTRPDSMGAILKRFKGIHPYANIEPYEETDQFLIPNEL